VVGKYQASSIACFDLAWYLANAVEIGRLPLAHASHLLMDLCHFRLAEVRRLADRECMDIHPRQRLHLNGEPERLFKRLRRYDQAMMAEQAGVAIFERLEGIVRQGQRAETCIRRTADIIPTRLFKVTVAR
jgi:hypothetical protein